jgi:2-polyprenyl-6-methoxyphenol hydroxylase-like FAD-dependent oxidoreductase
VKVLIVGAGIGGLSAALALRARGFRPVVWERSPAPQRGGHLIEIQRSGLEVLDRFGLATILRHRCFKLGPRTIQTAGGRPLRRRHARPASTGSLTLNRASLHGALFARASEECEIRFNEPAQHVGSDERSAWAEGNQGRREEFDLVVAADGVRSTIRQQIFGDGALHPLGAAYVAFTIPNRATLPYGTWDVWTRGAYVNVHTSIDGDVGAYFIYPTTTTTVLTDRERRSVLARNFGSFAAPVAPLIDSLTDADVLFHDTMLQVDQIPWTMNRIVLLGDAAQCLSLISGQGASMAMIGAWVLARELASSSDIPSALWRYESALRPVVRLQRSRAAGAARWLLSTNPVTATAMILASAFLPFKFIDEAVSVDHAAYTLLTE